MKRTKRAKLNKHVQTKTKQENKIKTQMQNKKGRKRKRKVRLNTLDKSFPSLNLTVSLNQIYSQINKRVISNIKLKGLGLEKVSIK